MEKQRGTPLVRYQKKQLMEVIIAAFITQVLFPYLKNSLSSMIQIDKNSVSDHDLNLILFDLLICRNKHSYKGQIIHSND